jgi:hypothetical protein
MRMLGPPNVKKEEFNGLIIGFSLISRQCVEVDARHTKDRDRSSDVSIDLSTINIYLPHDNAVGVV